MAEAGAGGVERKQKHVANEHRFAEQFGVPVVGDGLERSNDQGSQRPAAGDAMDEGTVDIGQGPGCGTVKPQARFVPMEPRFEWMTRPGRAPGGTIRDPLHAVAPSGKDALK